MKAILYTGAALMIGAGIYGFVDYKQTRGKKEFKTMYEAPVSVTEPAPAAVTEPAPATGNVPAAVTETKETVKKAAPAKKKTARKKKRTFSTKLFSRGALDERYIDPPPAPAPVKSEPKAPAEKQ